MLIHLKGNHDVFMEDALHSESIYQFWIDPLLGGQETLDSYGGNLDAVPASHWEFLASAKLYHELEDFICVHGGVDAELPLDQQSSELLLNHRFNNAAAHISGKTVVCGHTRQTDGIPKIQDNTLCIDTNVFDGGFLTAFDTETATIYQVDGLNQKKSYPLDQLL